ncbi:MAG: glycosyltransferase [Bacteroidetes bacterium]|nr:glycosyltransferase [Bacteroidota bacterium]
MKLALIYNYPLHYREAIFKKIDVEYDTDFYFGDKLQERIKGFDVNQLRGEVKILKNILFKKRVLWRKGLVNISLKKYDKYIVLGEFHNLSLWLLLIILKIRGKDVYNWTHGCYGKEGKIIMILKKIFYSLNTGVLVYGEYAKKIMIKNGVKERKISVIYNSLDYDHQKKMREEVSYSDIYSTHFENNYDVLIFSGRLTKVKDISILIKAHKYMVDNYGDNINVVIVGDGDEKASLIAEVERNSLTKRYWFYGETYDERTIAELYYNASICVSPGNVGLTAMHAMMYGCPVITHSDFKFQMPEYEVIENGKTGMFFEKSSIHDLAHCIKEWLKYSSKNRGFIRRECFVKIDKYYNPHYQMRVIKKVLC